MLEKCKIAAIINEPSVPGVYILSVYLPVPDTEGQDVDAAPRCRIEKGSFEGLDLLAVRRRPFREEDDVKTHMQYILYMLHILQEARPVPPLYKDASRVFDDGSQQERILELGVRDEHRGDVGENHEDVQVRKVVRDYEVILFSAHELIDISQSDLYAEHYERGPEIYGRYAGEIPELHHFVAYDQIDAERYEEESNYQNYEGEYLDRFK